MNTCILYSDPIQRFYEEQTAPTPVGQEPKAIQLAKTVAWGGCFYLFYSCCCVCIWLFLYLFEFCVCACERERDFYICVYLAFIVIIFIFSILIFIADYTVSFSVLILFTFFIFINFFNFTICSRCIDTSLYRISSECESRRVAF